MTRRQRPTVCFTPPIVTRISDIKKRTPTKEEVSVNAIEIPKQRMVEILEDEDAVVQDRILGTSRWCIEHTLIFRHEGRLWTTSYRVGATEMQDEGPWENQTDVTSYEVEAYERTIIDYRAVKS